MAKHEYRVTTVSQSGVEMMVAPSALHNVPCDRWTSATASEYARLRRHPEGTIIRVERRRPTKRQDGSWLPYRAYLVGEDGIVRRTDR